ncbi:hypothetical protein BpHYR1_000314 [Brachionus plicatilis]|uniref:SWIM-type domain-containing protein n=1 Tax=Brachionus plicatilis TaxID=10195 RepID=A0A3M7SHS5_BRAPC|nr:hypothetical protein BpHYR1_000314 [Brachionus plicatilis]
MILEFLVIQLYKDYDLSVVLRPVVSIESIVEELKNDTLTKEIERLCLESDSSARSCVGNDSAGNSLAGNSLAGNDSVEPKNNIDLTKTSKILRAKWFIEQGLIQFCPQMSCFNIRDENNKIYMVILYPKQSCSCANGSDCCHIIYVQLSIGAVSTVKNTTKKLTLTKLKANKNQKSGRKYRNNIDEKEIVVPVKKTIDIQTVESKVDEKAALELFDSFDFKNLIDECDIIVKPDDLPCGVVNIDFNTYKNFFTEDGFEALVAVLNAKKQSIGPKREKKTLSKF